MKGIIFNLLEEVVRSEHGDAAWESLLEASALDGAYTSIGSYPDEHLMRLVDAASAALGQPAPEIIRWFGLRSLPLLAKRYPHFFVGHRSLLTFLPTLNHTIHSEVQMIYPGAEVPVFTFDLTTPDTLRMVYISKRRLCALAQGFIEASAAHFGEPAEITQPLCLTRGDERCEFLIVVAPMRA